MKFKVSLEDIKNSLSKVLPAIPPKSTLPVLEQIFVKISGGKLIAISTDQDITIQSTMDVESDEPGEFLIPARQLNDNIKNISPNSLLEFNINTENFSISAESSDRSRFVMKGLNPEEYPDLPELNAEPETESDLNECTIPKDQIARLCGKTSFAVSTDEFRPAMTGVFFQFRESYVNAVATDSYRLVRATYKPENADLPKELDLIIPAKTIDLVKSADSDVALNFLTSNGKLTHLRFEIGSTIYVSRVIDEKFPPYESVIPKENQLIALVDKSQLLSAIKFVAPSSSTISKQIKLTLNENQLTIKGYDDESGTEASREINCEYSGDEIIIGFNYKFLEEAVSNVEAGDDNIIYLTLSEPTRPALILPEAEGKELLMLIMPVRLN